MMLKPTELVRFTDDTYVIVGEHLTVEEVQSQFGKEYDEMVDADHPAIIDFVKHYWVRYEYLGELNCPDEFDAFEPGTAIWILREQTKRPKGVVRKATVINP